MVVLILLTGCARPGMRFPGPIKHMGDEPMAYADQLEEQEEAEEEEEPAEGEAVAEDRGRRRGNRAGLAVARGAAKLIDAQPLVVSGTTYRYDCSGLVSAAYAHAGRDLDGSGRDMFELAKDAGVLHRRKRPFPGDVAFFDDTHDRDGDGRRNDELTHVEIVETVDEDGTITLIHLGSKGVTRNYMNLYRPHDKRDDDKVINSQLRSPKDEDGGPVLTAELWRAFGSLWSISDPLLSSLGDPAGLDAALETLGCRVLPG